jgi:hypothetical protein
VQSHHLHLASTIQCRVVDSSLQPLWISPEFLAETRDTRANHSACTGADLDPTALRITQRFCSRYRNKIMTAETQLALADLSLEEARSPAEQEAAVRQALEFFQKQKARDDEINALCVLARALLAEGKAAAAARAMQHARLLAGKSQNPEIRWRTAIAAARIDTAGKRRCPLRSLLL